MDAVLAAETTPVESAAKEAKAAKEATEAEVAAKPALRRKVSLAAPPCFATFNRRRRS